MPFLLVFSVSNGVPGRGLVLDAGVDSSTGIFGAGVPAIVTKTAALVIEGLGLGETGEDDGVGVVELPWQAAVASVTAMRARSKRLDMGGSLRRLRASTRVNPACKDESSVEI